jgi:hypothetical protein
MSERAELMQTPGGFVARPARVPPNAVLLALADAWASRQATEARRRMWVAPVGALMAQVYSLDGAICGPPVPRREAGLW